MSSCSCKPVPSATHRCWSPATSIASRLRLALEHHRRRAACPLAGAQPRASRVAPSAGSCYEVHIGLDAQRFRLWFTISLILLLIVQVQSCEGTF